jgi:hypothetical protein
MEVGMAIWCAMSKHKSSMDPSKQISIEFFSSLKSKL